MARLLRLTRRRTYVRIVAPPRRRVDPNWWRDRWTPQARLFKERYDMPEGSAVTFAELWAGAGWFDEPAIRAWLDIGAEPEHASIVGKLVDNDITPDLARVRIRHRGRVETIFEHVRSGRLTAPAAREALVARRKLRAKMTT